MIFLDILDVVSVGEDRGESPELASFFWRCSFPSS